MLAVLRRAFRGPCHYHLAYMFTQRMRFWAASQISFRCEGLHIRYNVRLVLAQNGFFQLCDFGISVRECREVFIDNVTSVEARG